ncbi:ATP-dependent DNA helicase RecG [Nannocystis sp.]|uniref:ATP-dependent DNA helicase RecG n=1 Tax=Nannocystis sp. TaxID=1962667 RepID=UPI0025E7E076|nr:ATP-dependent DNA helicase RecG [Nannocystis sp.]MBK7824012.1 ATP-dependent DNA helicase RecG [Nannocystis sp.]
MAPAGLVERPGPSGAAAIDSPWDALTGLPGVGPRTAAKLGEQGLRSCWDLLRWIPVDYRDHRRRDRVDQVADGVVAVIEATIRRFKQSFFRGRYLATMELVQDTADGPRAFVARWFHRVGGLSDRAVAGRRVRMIGKVARKGDTVALIHPELHDADDEGPAIAVRYPDIEGLGDSSVARLCLAALARAQAHAVDPLPEQLRLRLGLPSLLPALGLLHAPPGDLPEASWRELLAGRTPAHRRVLFDDLLHVQLALLRQRAAYRAAAPPVGLLPAEHDRRERLRACVPFEPTSAQWRAVDEIETDLAAPRPMLRLVQGEVGAGKTFVAFAAIQGIVEAGGQAALMAPTEILAAQHLRSLAPWCEAAGLRIALLTGATSRPERAALLTRARIGALDLLIGTHALLGEGVHFRRLGLVVIDEQHRFGVAQRALLRDKGSAPHLLVMTATPIPRTLALTLFGELDVSVLDELPPGRTPPQTRLFAGPRSLAAARAALADLVRGGRSAFVVCPQVEAGTREVSDVEAAAADLRERLPGAAIGVLHGRMAARDKEAAVAAFRSGALAVLVATTVIEVGVDIPAAQAMLVEHADCFGLAQLHQLRGRIGRGPGPVPTDRSSRSGDPVLGDRQYELPVPEDRPHGTRTAVPSPLRPATPPGGAPVCLLHTPASPGSEAAARLQVLVDTCDGFRVAEQDLAERGPGELFGLRQAGTPRQRIAGLAGELTRLLDAARDAAQEILARDPDLQAHPELRAELTRRAEHGVVGGDAG